jgi:nucleotidyltransferase/DNA polymerase involved in DNA repair
MQASIETTDQSPLKSASLPLLESAPAWSVHVARLASPDRNELAQELRGVPKAALRQVFGKLLGIRLWQQNRAAANTSSAAKNLTADAAKNLIAAETVSDTEISGGMLRYLCSEAAATLRERKRAAKSISLTVQYSDGQSETAHQLFLESTNDLASLEAAALAAIRGMRSNAFVSLKLDVSATAARA